MKKYLIFAGMGFELVGLILGAYFVGNHFDNKYQTNGLIFVGLSFAGLIGWLVRVIWLINRLQKQEDRES